ncbi:MAG TPA: hypothetical protein DCW68_06035 [Rhodospirillaceae bacterium]|nr:MAG: hypothetical protein A2018_03600 [Alphaproteobacteria bacterium GWF2_58_20]HAU29653.1 hypothetical protein [Rhodospirillaceae bacterium]
MKNPHLAPMLLWVFKEKMKNGEKDYIQKTMDREPSLVHALRDETSGDTVAHLALRWQKNGDTDSQAYLDVLKTMAEKDSSILLLKNGNGKTVADMAIDNALQENNPRILNALLDNVPILSGTGAKHPESYMEARQRMAIALLFISPPKKLPHPALIPGVEF